MHASERDGISETGETGKRRPREESEMQISTQEVSRVVERSSTRGGNAPQEAPVRTVQDLAAKYGVKMDEVRHFTERAMMADEDPLRERRVRELARRIADGSYNVEGEQILEMAERRSIADQAGSM